MKECLYYTRQPILDSLFKMIFNYYTSESRTEIDYSMEYANWIHYKPTGFWFSIEEDWEEFLIFLDDFQPLYSHKYQLFLDEDNILDSENIVDYWKWNMRCYRLDILPILLINSIEEYDRMYQYFTNYGTVDWRFFSLMFSGIIVNICPHKIFHDLSLEKYKDMEDGCKVSLLSYDARSGAIWDFRNIVDTKYLYEVKY